MGELEGEYSGSEELGASPDRFSSYQGPLSRSLSILSCQPPVPPSSNSEAQTELSLGLALPTSDTAARGVSLELPLTARDSTPGVLASGPPRCAHAPDLLRVSRTDFQPPPARPPAGAWAVRPFAQPTVLRTLDSPSHSRRSSQLPPL